MPLNRPPVRGHLAGVPINIPQVPPIIPLTVLPVPSAPAAVGRSLGLPHPPPVIPPTSVAGSAPRECAYRGPRRVCHYKIPADVSLLGPHSFPRVCLWRPPQMLHVDTPGDPRRSPRGGFASRFCGRVCGSPAAGSVLVSVALPAVASAESPAAGSVGLSPLT